MNRAAIRGQEGHRRGGFVPHFWSGLPPPEPHFFIWPLRNPAPAISSPLPWFDVQERGGQPAMALTRVLPVIDFRTAFLDEGIDGLQPVRCLQ